MNAQKAIETLSKRGDKIAEDLNVNEGPGWRDNTGTAHLYIRGALQSLERIAKNQHSEEDVDIAAGTVAFAHKSPDGFLGENVEKAAEIATKILGTERSGGTFSDAITPEDLQLITDDLQNFTNDIVGQASQPESDESLKAFAKTLESVNKHYQQLLQADWKGTPSAPSGDLKDKPNPPTSP